MSNKILSVPPELKSVKLLEEQPKLQTDCPFNKLVPLGKTIYRLNGTVCGTEVLK